MAERHAPLVAALADAKAPPGKHPRLGDKDGSRPASSRSQKTTSSAPTVSASTARLVMRGSRVRATPLPRSAPATRRASPPRSILPESAEAGHEALHGLLHRRGIHRPVSDPQVAAIVHPEDRAGNHRDAVLADQALDERHGIAAPMNPDEEIERSVRPRHRHPRSEAEQRVKRDSADRDAPVVAVRALRRDEDRDGTLPFAPCLALGVVGYAAIAVAVGVG